MPDQGLARTLASEGIRVPATSESLSFDEARDWMESHPCTLSAANLLEVATQYHADGMIGDDTYNSAVRLVAEHLRKRL